AHVWSGGALSEPDVDASAGVLDGPGPAVGDQLDSECAPSRQIRRTAGRAGLDGQPRAPLVPRHAGPGALSRQVVLADAVVLVERVLPVRAAEDPQRRGLADGLARVLADGVQRDDRS